MDKAALFTQITRRNELRREAHLPLLDVRTELDHAAQLAATQEYDDFCAQHEAKLKEFRNAVMTERRSKDPNYGHTKMGWWSVNHEAQQRFENWIEQTFGITRPDFRPKNLVSYGQDKK